MSTPGGGEPGNTGAGRRRRRDLTSWAIFALTLLLYLGSFEPASDGQILGNDVIHYAVELAARPDGSAWNPHHLLYHPLAAVATALWRTLTLAPMGVEAALQGHQLLSALGGAWACMILFRFARRLAGWLPGLCLTGIFAFSSGTWLYSAVGESYMSANAALALLLTRAVELRLGLRRTSPVLLGALLYLALLLRQDSVLVVPALIFLLPRTTFLLAVGGAGCLTAGMYGLAWILSGSEVSWFVWLRGLETTGLWGGGVALKDVSGSLWALLLCFTFLGYRHVLWALALVAPLVAALIPPRRLDRSLRAAVIALALFALVRLAFITWWQPGNMEYHAGTLLPLTMVAALLYDPRLERGPSRWRVGALGACALGLGLSTWLTVIAPNRGVGMALQARAALELAGEGGRVICLDPWQRFAVLREGPPPGTALDASGFAAAHPDLELEVPPQLRSEIDRTLAQGRNVVLSSDRILAEFYGVKTWTVYQERVQALRGGHPARPLLDERDRAWGLLLEGAPR